MFVEKLDFVDGQILPQTEFWQQIQSLEAHVLLISASIRQMKSAQKIATTIKENKPDTIVILGGPGPSGFSVQPVTNNVDVIVKGEAEEVLPILLEQTFKHEPFVISSQLAHVTHESDSMVISVCKLPDVNAHPLPDRTIFDNVSYEKRWRISANMNSMTLIGSRGCPFHCLFCDHSVTGYGVRYRDVRNIADEMVSLQRLYKPDDIFFYDDLFTTRKSRVKALCKLLAPHGITWSVQGRVDCITEEMLKDMKSAGCTELMFGVESGSDTILRYFRKGFTRKQIIDAFQLCHKVGMKPGAYLIIGVPGETRQDILQTISLIEEIEPTLVNISYLTPFPATSLYAMTNQWVRPVEYDEWDDFQTSIYDYPFEIEPIKAEEMILAAYRSKIAQGMPFSAYQFANADMSSEGESNESH
jgi:radical SAM superfamily enzyme YgiQ (UPF0313 family)